jgi:hypothetical protein
VLSFWTILFWTAALSIPTSAQSVGAKVYADKTNRVHIVFPDGRRYSVRGERNQVGIEDAKAATDYQTVGWLVDYLNEGERSPEAGTLVVFRKGRVVRRFDTGQVFWSWAFFVQGTQVAYHIGPTHGDIFDHCELHDVASGRLLDQWGHDTGDPGDSKRPIWVKSLER